MRNDLEIIDDVRSIISKSLKIPIERLTPEARLDELGAESLDVIEIVFELEEKFDITIPLKADEGTHPAKPDQRSENAEMQFSTIGDIATIVKQLVEAKTSR
jgi:acyl carrier protein